MTVINIVLAIMSLIAYLAAFGGKTWVEGPELIFKRITFRGYIALVAILFSFSIGIYKEVSVKNVIAGKDTEIKALNSKVDRLKGSIDSYKDILDIVKDESHRQEQIVMSQAVNLHGQWRAPNILYPGSLVKFYTYGRSTTLKIKYGNDHTRYRTQEINIRPGDEGIPYEIPIVGNSGEKFDWSLIGDWEGKVYVLSSPRQRENQWSWQEESRVN
jgi:hypothetical protein